MLVVILAIPALCVWTGYGLLQIMGPAKFRSDVPDGIFSLGLAGVLLLGWIALITAELGVFSALAVSAFGVLLGSGGWLVARRRGTRVTLNWSSFQRGEAIFLVILIALIGVLNLRPHQFIFGGADAGVYVSLGANLSRTHDWLIHNPDLSAIPPDDYEMLFREHSPHLIPRYIHLPGFYISDNNTETILPQFYPLHPVWLAVAHGLGGVWANLFLTPLWGLLAVLALYFAIRESFGRRLAAVAALVLAFTPTQIWFSRYPTSEALTQFLLLSGFYAFARHIRQGETWSAALAGIALGQAMLARPDMYFLLGIPPVYAAYLHLTRRFSRHFWVFTGSMLAMGTHSILHAVWLDWPYLHNTYFLGNSAIPKYPAFLIGGLTFLTITSIILGKITARIPDTLTRLQPAWRILRSIAAVCLVLLAAYAYFLRPLQADPTREINYWYAQTTFPDVEPYNLVRLGWYLSPLGVGLGVLGAALILHERINGRTWPLVSIGIFYSILFVYYSFNNPHHVYVMRRYVPAVIPMFVIGAAYAILRLANWRQIGLVLAPGLILMQVSLMLYTNQAMIQQVDYRGSVSQFRSLSAQIPSGALVLFNGDSPIGTASVFGTPLAYIDGHTVLDLQEDHLDLDRLDALVQGWLTEGRSVIVIDGPSRVSGMCDRWHCSSLGVAQFNFSVLEASYEHRPTGIIPVQRSLDVYAVESVQP
jgi:4-amino-4-deoxy-L-arabinose transferase-like glycosyltransferase